MRYNVRTVSLPPEYSTFMIWEPPADAMHPQYTETIDGNDPRENQYVLLLFLLHTRYHSTPRVARQLRLFPASLFSATEMGVSQGQIQARQVHLPSQVCKGFCSQQFSRVGRVWSDPSEVWVQTSTFLNRFCACSTNWGRREQTGCTPRRLGWVGVQLQSPSLPGSAREE